MSRIPHILIVDDDAKIRTSIARFLTRQSLRVSQAADGTEMAAVLATGNVDLVLLDIMLPGEDGLTLCRRLRAEGNIPVVLLTAVTDETDRIVGLELGADDYVCKPFNPRELLARLRAVLRRTQAAPRVLAKPELGIYRFDGWTFDSRKRLLTSPSGTLVELTTGEFELLLAFAEHPQQVLSRNQLLDLARGRSSIPFDRSMDVQVMRLRRKLEPDPNNPEMIKTVRNGGYVFTPVVETPSKER